MKYKHLHIFTHLCNRLSRPDLTHGSVHITRLNIEMDAIRLLLLTSAILLLTTVPLSKAEADVTSAVSGRSSQTSNELRKNPYYFHILGRCIRRYGHSCLGGHGKRSGQMSSSPMLMMISAKEKDIRHPMFDLWRSYIQMLSSSKFRPPFSGSSRLN